MTALSRTLLGLVRRVAPASGVDWLEAALGEPSACARHFPAVARHVGREALATSDTLAGPDDPVSLALFTADLAGRAALLVSVGEHAPNALEGAVGECFARGDTLEKIAVVRTLPLLPGGARFVSHALAAGRTNETPLFEALACENPFGARHYGDLEWNKLVMKAAFVGLGLERIVGLDRRTNADLARMGMAYIDEQEAAFRRFAPEIWRAIAPFSPPGAVARMLGYASHAAETVRLGAVRGLSLAGDARALDFLAERRAVDGSAPVQEALDRAIAVIRSGRNA